MNSYLENDLSNLNSRGLFPGPDETQDHFFKRVSLALFHATEVPEALKIVRTLFDAAPDWVEIQKNSKGLLAWEGAAAWIEEDCNGCRTTTIQIKPSLVWYSADEVLAHELVHAMRICFDENRFEEILAYQTCRNRFRRYFGPLFSKPSEVKWFIFVTVAMWVFFWAEMLLEAEWGGEFLCWTPLCLLSLGVFRLIQSQRLFSSALKNIENAIRIPGKSLAVVLRLSDAEILRFAKSPSQEILTFARQQTSLRWRQLYAAYFEN